MTGQELKLMIQDILNDKVELNNEMDDGYTYMYKWRGVIRGDFKILITPLKPHSYEAMCMASSIAACLQDPTNKSEPKFRL